MFKYQISIIKFIFKALVHNLSKNSIRDKIKLNTKHILILNVKPLNFYDKKANIHFLIRVFSLMINSYLLLSDKSQDIRQFSCLKIFSF